MANGENQHQPGADNLDVVDGHTVREEEIEHEIARRRRRALKHEDSSPEAIRKNLVGLAISGGASC